MAGNYIIESHLGTGGMATVYRARHAVLGRTCAIKVLLPSLRANAHVRRRFLGEALVGSALVHPNIVRVEDTISTEDIAGLVMEYVEGPSLEDYIGRLACHQTAALARSLFLPVLDAVGFAHRNGVIHRDIKPANILLAGSGTLIVPKVTDFGIAKLGDVLGGRRPKQSTALDARMGTPGYMSPEQIRSPKNVTPQSDIFALGATLYELVTCKPAFSGASDYEVMDNVVRGAYPPLAVGSGGVDASLAFAIQRALDPDPVKRFQSCDEFAAVLSPRAEAAGPRVGATPAASRRPHPATPVPVPKRRISRKSLVLLSATSLVAIAVVAIALRSTDSPGRASREDAPSALRTKSAREGWGGPRPFAVCRTGSKSRVVVGYLSATRPPPASTEIRRWFAAVPSTAVTFHRVAAGSNRKHLISMELSRDSWSVWRNIEQEIAASAADDEICWRVGIYLLEHAIGPRFRKSDGSLDIEVLPVERKNPSELLGDLDFATSTQGMDQMEAWLRPTPPL